MLVAPKSKKCGNIKAVTSCIGLFNSKCYVLMKCIPFETFYIIWSAVTEIEPSSIYVISDLTKINGHVCGLCFMLVIAIMSLRNC